MILLSLQHIHKAFGVNVVLKDASLTLQDGQRMGLVGVNGSGKSTLLRIVAGLSRQDGGQVSLAKGLRIGYLAQQGEVEPGHTVWETLEAVYAPVFAMEERMRAAEEEMAAFHEDEARFAKLSSEYTALTDAFEEAEGYAWRSAIQGVLTGLGLPQERWHAQVDVLSGGERTRLCLARLLLTRPDILLLDEPTNHLDLEATGWLENYLRGYKGSVLVVSHDRYLLDAVCTHMAELLLGEIEQYNGNYSAYLKQREERFATRIRAYELQQKEITRQEAIITRFRMYNTERSIGLAESREKALARMDMLEKPTDERTIRFAFKAGRRTGEDVLRLTDLSKGYDGRTLFEHLSLLVRAGERIAIIGPNGIGKSTLFRIITGQEQPDTGEVRFGSNVDLGYYDQHQAGLHPEKSILDEVWDRFPRMEQTDIRNALGAFLFSGEDVFQPIHTLSGGEKGRVALTILMLGRDNLLLLDEPTNHLDMDSREVLENALADFDGTVLTISHDRYFINRLATAVLEMQNDGLTLYLGNYDDYLAKKNQLRAPEETGPQVTRTQQDKQKKRDRASRAEEKARKEALIGLEREIEDVEARIAVLEAQLADPATYQDGELAAEVSRTYQQEQELLETLYGRWETEVE